MRRRICIRGCLSVRRSLRRSVQRLLSDACETHLAPSIRPCLHFQVRQRSSISWCVRPSLPLCVHRFHFGGIDVLRSTAWPVLSLVLRARGTLTGAEVMRQVRILRLGNFTITNFYSFLVHFSSSLIDSHEHFILQSLDENPNVKKTV